MTYRATKQRALQKAGLVHVAGWVRAEDAPDIQERIETAKAEVERVLSNDK